MQLIDRQRFDTTISRSIDTGRLITIALLMLAAVFTGFGPVAGQAEFSIGDFEPVGYMAKLDGKPLQDSEIFQSRAAGAFLILASELPARSWSRFGTARCRRSI